MLKPFRWLWVFLKEVGQKFLADNGTFLASGLAFYLMLYCIPLSLLIVSALGYTLIGSEEALKAVQHGLQQVLPPSQQKKITESLANVVDARGLLGFAGFLSLLIFSSTLFASVRTALNVVFEAPQNRPFLRGMGRDLLVMAAIPGLLVLTFLVHSLLALVREFGENLPLIGAWLGPGWVLLGKIVGFLFIVMFFWVLYRFSPARTLGRRGLAIAALTGAGLFQLSKGLFVLYFSFAKTNAGLYGALGGLIFFFLWLYYASTVFLLGATVGWIYEQMMSRKPATQTTESGGA